jgi:hypothetical protein
VQMMTWQVFSYYNTRGVTRVDAASLNNTSDVRDGASPIETRNQCKNVDDNICKLDIEYVTSNKKEDRYTRGKSPPSPPQAPTPSSWPT